MFIFAATKRCAMYYFEDLLQELQLEYNVPLWKIVNRMDEDRQKELVKRINDNLNAPYRIGREVCLLYACWWRYKYRGGVGGHNYSQIINDYGLLNLNGNTDSILRKIIKDELTGWRQLNIPLYQGESGKNRYLDSVLAQGGIPEAFLKTGNNNFLTYLLSLINYYQRCDSNAINWHDNSIARQKSRYLPETFRKEPFYNICLTIVQSIINDTDEFSDYQDIKEIVTQVKRQSASSFSSAFRISWSIEINATKAYLCYSLHIPQRIHAGNSERHSSTRRYYLDECFVAEYRLIGDHYVLMSHIPVTNKKVTANDGVLFLQYTEDNTLAHEGRPFMPPQLDEPTLLQVGDGNHWMIEPSHGESYMGCLIPQGWNLLSDKSFELHPIAIDNVDYHWCAINWNEVSTLEFEKDGVHISLNNHIVNEGYDVVLNLPQFDWIVRASMLIIPKTDGNSQINLLDGKRIYVKDETEQMVSRHKWSLQYKCGSMANFEDYVASNLPFGKVVFNIELPDGQHKRFSAFVVNEMKYCAQTNNVSFSAGNEIVTTLRNKNSGITKNGNNYLFDARDITKKAIYLLLSANGSDIQLDIEIPTSSSVFVGLDDITLPNNHHIALSEIDYYRVFLVGSRLRLNYVHNGINGDETIASAYVNITPGCFHSLSYAREVIEKLLLLYPYNRNNEIRITAGQQTIIVGRHTYNTFLHREEAGQGIQILTNNKPADGLKIAAVTLPDSNNLEDIDLIPSGEGKYLIPSDFASTQMIAFSRNASQGISPIRIDPNENIPDYGNLDSENEHRKIRNQQKKESIKICQEELEDGNKQDWDSVWYYWNIIHDNQLPYTAFNCFLAMASNPYLLAKFCASIHQHADITSWGEQIIVRELERMEYELGFAFHYIPRETWGSIRQGILDEYDQLPTVVHNVLKVDDYLNGALRYVIAVFDNQFEEIEADRCNSLIFNLLYGTQMSDERLGWNVFQHYLDNGISNTYLSNNASDNRAVDRINIPYQCNPNQVSFAPPQISNRHQDSAECFMQYHCIIMPQVAAKNAFEFDPTFWQYNETHIVQRRLINYIRRYAKTVYNDIFYTAFNEKMKQL